MVTCEECGGFRKVDCIHCYGKGKKENGEPCQYCKGKKMSTCHECGGTGRTG